MKAAAKENPIEIKIRCAHQSLERAATLKPHPRNPNKHPKKQVDLLAKIISETGFRAPIVVSKLSGFITKGHLRCMAALKIDPAIWVPVDFQDYDSEAQELADMIADNKIAEMSELDRGLLEEIFQLLPPDFDHELTALTGADFQLDAAIKQGADEVEQVPDITSIKTGDLFELGHHRLLCGDSIKKADVDKLLAGRFPMLMVTDPPYGVNYDPAWRREAGVNKNTKKLGKVSNDDTVDWRAAWALYTGPVAYVWHAGRFASEVAESLKSTGMEIVSQIIWVKDRFALSRGDYHWQHEPCWYVVRDGEKHNWQGRRDEATTWTIPARDDDGQGHGTQKPLECMMRPILNNSAKGDVIYDPFCGSGTTLIACEESERSCMAMEIDPVYCQAIINRWEKVTGRKARQVEA